ncbi:hypothetical protein PoMZ_03860 [Pyricularia oryzae]|uniref:Uncharacterized protein n=1 Tax=Pyricularia oryzae TaxID=318829 RepID=A0A4P7NAZ7_PYROR|nr:hypothetical protein PoMZ_03860 [Pyricularia oryzae]
MVVTRTSRSRRSWLLWEGVMYMREIVQGGNVFGIYVRPSRCVIPHKPAAFIDPSRLVIG